ncbi:MAG: Zn-ribbon domain-containing OB-fold protein [Chloroflexi bacterium]|nr:Zn-ribbon domain-containing OB-fold protein [Chloroflexota bacterium]
MPKLIPVADEQSKPFWDAANERRLLVHKCTACNTLQFPPQPTCRDCGSAKLEWTQASGRGHILTYFVVHDGRFGRRMADQPYNVAVIALDEDPRVNFYANLPGVPPHQVPVGAAVKVIFEEVEGGQLVPDWQVVR